MCQAVARSIELRTYDRHYACRPVERAVKVAGERPSAVESDHLVPYVRVERRAVLTPVEVSDPEESRAVLEIPDRVGPGGAGGHIEMAAVELDRVHGFAVDIED